MSQLCCFLVSPPAASALWQCHAGIAVHDLLLCAGEIVPQAICSHYGLAIGAWTAWFVRFLMIVSAPISWPISKLLDYLLGSEHTVRRSLPCFIIAACLHVFFLVAWSLPKAFNLLLPWGSCGLAQSFGITTLPAPHVATLCCLHLLDGYHALSALHMLLLSG